MGMAALTAGGPTRRSTGCAGLSPPTGVPRTTARPCSGCSTWPKAGRRTGRQAETGELIEGAFAATEGELSPRLRQARALCRALLTAGPGRGALLEALAVADGDHVPFERARVRLGYGQWLHRERRDKDARPHLNAAAHVFRRLAATPWLETVTREQRATGVPLRPGPSRAPGEVSALC